MLASFATNDKNNNRKDNVSKTEFGSASNDSLLTGTGLADASPTLRPTATDPSTLTSAAANDLPLISNHNARLVNAGEFEPEAHFYPRVLNAQIHPLVASFFSLGNERIIARYVHLNPQVDESKLRQVLNYTPMYFAWAGCDLFNVTNANGHRNMIVIETNSCPSGQKSMPLITDTDEHGGYGVVLEHTFRGLLEQADPALGGLAVVCDKNAMEASGYAAVMADVMKEPVHLVEYYNEDPDPAVRWLDQVMQIRDAKGDWHSIRACFRYVTQKPWNRFPLVSKTIVLNSIISCLSGGRNKMMAARAYDFYNSELQSENAGLEIRVPETIRNVTKHEIPLWVETMGGHAVLKVPYSNAGQGVYTITNQAELDAFMVTPQHYDKYIVQSLVGNASWSSITRHGKYYHVGTIPNRRNHTYISDLRMMIAGSTTGKGFTPVAIYARRARKPLLKNLSDDPTCTSWEMLGTNLSVKLKDDGHNSNQHHQLWTTETQRLLLMDRKDFNSLGIGIDDLIDAYVQTVLSVIAIDKMCQRLMPQTEIIEEREREIGDTDMPPPMPLSDTSGSFEIPKTKVEVLEIIEKADGHKYVRERITRYKRRFDSSLFEALNPDKALLQEITR